MSADDGAAAEDQRGKKTFWSTQFSVDSEFPSGWDLTDTRISLTSPYGLSSFTYACTGVLMLTFFSDLNYRQSALKTLVLIEGACMCIQSVATIQADVLWLGRTSAWHAWDRALATINTVLVMGNTVFLEWDSILFYVFMVVSGLVMLGRSRKARVSGTLGEFAAWHTLWHFWFPCGILIWLLHIKYDENNQNDSSGQACTVVIGSCVLGPAFLIALYSTWDQASQRPRKNKAL